MEENFTDQPQYITRHRWLAFSIDEPCVFEPGRICVRKISKLSSSTSVYSCGLHLSKLVSEQWRQLRSSINSTGCKYSATNTMYLIASGPLLC